MTEQEILDLLSSERFARWYLGGNFDLYIRGETPEVSKGEILKEIKKIFKIN